MSAQQKCSICTFKMVYYKFTKKICKFSVFHNYCENLSLTMQIPFVNGTTFWFEDTGLCKTVTYCFVLKKMQCQAQWGMKSWFELALQPWELVTKSLTAGRSSVPKNYEQNWWHVQHALAWHGTETGQPLDLPRPHISKTMRGTRSNTYSKSTKYMWIGWMNSHEPSSTLCNM